MNHSRTDDVKLCKMLKGMLTGITIVELAGICGSEATAYRYLNVLEDVYKVEISNIDKQYKLVAVGDDSIWRMIFSEIL